MLDKGEQLIVTAFKVRVYTGIAHASTLKASVYIYFSIWLIFANTFQKITQLSRMTLRNHKIEDKNKGVNIKVL